MKKILVFILLSLIIQCGDYDKDENVIILNNDNIDEALEEFDHLFIKFYAPWCDHCKEMANDWKEAAKTLKDKNVQLAELDCTKDHPNKSCTKYLNSGYPTLKFFSKKRKEPKLFEGQREKSQFIKFALENVDHVTEIVGKSGNVYEGLNGYIDLNDSNYGQALKDFKYIYVYYYKSCNKCNIYEGKWKRVVADLKKQRGDEILCARVDCDQESEACAKMEQFPKVALFMNGKMRGVHIGLTETKALVDFALQNAIKKDDL